MTMRGYNEGKERGQSNPVSLRLVRRLATAEDTEPEDIPSYAQEIDFEALDALISASSTDLTVCFRIDGYDVTVASDGSIELE